MVGGGGGGGERGEVEGGWDVGQGGVGCLVCYAEYKCTLTSG